MVDTQKMKRANLNTRISVNMFREAKTNRDVDKIMRHHSLTLHPNKYQAKHNQVKAKKKFQNLTTAAERRKAELSGASSGFSYFYPSSGGSRNLVPRRSRQQLLGYNFRLGA